MALLWQLAVLAVLAGSSSARPNCCEPTTIENYPSIVQVDVYNPFDVFWARGCAGTIISRTYILSSAGCFTGFLYQPIWRRVRAGATHSDTGGVIHSVEAVFNHPSYNYDVNYDRDGDISVVKLATLLEYSPVIQPATIVAQNTTIPGNLPVVYAGWSATEDNGTTTDVIRHVVMYTINNKLCAERYEVVGRPFIVTENMICAGLLDGGGRDPCQGDLGGPLYYDNIVIGVTSWSYYDHDDWDENSAMYPGVSTNVASYTDWIVSVAV